MPKQCNCMKKILQQHSAVWDRLHTCKVTMPRQIELYEECLAIYVKAYGTREHAEVATTLNCMGQVADRQGDYAKAMQLLEESLAIKVKALQTVYGKAMQLYEESLAVKVKAYGTREHPSVAVTLNCMGQVASSQGDYAKAMQLYEESLAIKVKAYGTRQHPSVAITLHAMSVCYYKMVDRIRTQKCADEALKIFSKCLPPDHPHAAALHVFLSDMSG
ncbi:hypothetical protein BJ742DRAFT_36017 [Cladochytrium replicatum]|nr:hypothetical protein BJ742DRAFT_36017 [Cladochytrium replicatum]